MGTKTTLLIGERHKTKFGAEYTIIGYPDSKIRRIIQFDTGEIKEVFTSAIKSGAIRSRYDITVFSVGCMGEIDGVADKHPLYFRWTNMLGRCYSENHPHYKSYGAKGIYVEDYLKCFSNYVGFVSSLKNYQKMVNHPTEWQIDKDKNGGKIYSRKTICIIPSYENLEMENSKKRIMVDMISKQSMIVATFESISEAESKTGIHRGNIARSVRGGGFAGGYRWEASNAESILA